jgi:hypothetical protein
MFLIDCPEHGHRMLLGRGRIRAIRNTELAILVELECYCGHRATIATGRRADRTRHALAG